MRRLLPPSRTRRIAKRTGLGVCVVILAMWAVSTLVGVGWWRRSNPNVVVHLVGGALWVESPAMFPVRRNLGEGFDWAFVPAKRIDFGFIPPNVGSIHLGGTMITTVVMPYWLLLTLGAIPTAVLWRRDRRTLKPGCCRHCGYDLRASKKTCPECGEAALDSRDS